MKTQTVTNRAYHAARKSGKTVKQARKLAKDLNKAVVEAHDQLVEIDRQVLFGELRTGIITTKATTIRQATGLALATIARLKDDPIEDYHPRQSTLGSIALFLDLEIVTKKRGRRSTVVPIRRG